MCSELWHSLHSHVVGQQRLSTVWWPIYCHISACGQVGQSMFSIKTLMIFDADIILSSLASGNLNRFLLFCYITDWLGIHCSIRFKSVYAC